MRDPMVKRIPRELRRDIGKYIALFLFLTLIIGFISGFIVGDESLKRRYDTSFDEFAIEDGHFTLSEKASDVLLRKMEKEDISIIPLFYKEEEIDAAGKADKDTVRIYKVRDKVDLTALWEGRYPSSPDEITVDRLYAKNNGLSIGDTFSVRGNEYRITGFSSLSDYSALFRNNADTMFDATDFTVALVTEEGFGRIGDRNLKYCYAWINDEKDLTEEERHEKEENVKDALIDAVMDEVVVDPDMGSLFSSLTKGIDESIDNFGEPDEGDKDDDSMLKGMIKELNSIEDFVGRQSNQAINFTGDDMGKDRVMMTTLLYIVIVIMAFVFGITVKSTIEKEAKAIGTLRASGYSRKEMFIHYMTIPLLITLLSAVAGNVAGYTFMKKVCAAMYLQSYSLLPYDTVWSFNAFRDTTIVPLVIITLVMALVMSRELMLSPLQFLRGEFRSGRHGHAVKLKHGSFISRFRKRVLLQNISSYIVMFLGIFFSVIVMLFCLGMWPLLQHYEDIIMDSSMAEYQYILKEPCKVRDGQAEKYQVTSLKNADERMEDITVYGISSGSSYLSDLELPEDKNGMIVSSAYAKKYGLREGSTVRLKEEYKKKVYSFKVTKIYDYEAQLCGFLEMKNFNRTFDLDSDDYAGYLSDRALEEIPDDRIATVITKEDYATITKQLNSSMGGMFELFTIFGVIIFVIVIYLLSKVQIERNAKSISMVKILGMSDREISSVYNNVTAAVVFASLILSLPLGYLAFALIFRVMMAFFTGWLTYYLDPMVYVKVVLIGMASYLIVHMLELRRIRKVPMGEVLKGME